MTTEEGLKVLSAIQACHDGCSTCLTPILRRLARLFPEIDWEKLRA